MRAHAIGLALLVWLAAPPSPGRSLEPVPEPAVEWNPRGYECRRASEPPVPDGRLDEPDWLAAGWSERFVDIEGPSRPEPRFETRMKMLWDDECLYVGAEMTEPHVWGTLTRRDAVVYHDNDFEVFIDPDGDTHEYYELEVNALGTEWDLLLVRPYRDGGPAVDAWDIQGLRIGVGVDGTLNDPRDVDRGWTVEMAIPWAVLDDCAHRPTPPRNGDRWRMNFSRVEWQAEVRDGHYAKMVDSASGGPLPEDNWVWSPQGIVAMHYPEMWGFVEFSDSPPGGPPAPVEPEPADFARWDLRTVYYRERDFFAEHGRFTENLDELGLEELRGVTVWVTPRGFEASTETPDGAFGISEHGRVWSEGR